MTIDPRKIHALMQGLDVASEGWLSVYAKYNLDAMTRQHDLEGDNAILPWTAIRWCVQYELPVPVWVLEYFAGRAEKIQDFLDDDGRNSLNEAETIARILGFAAEGRGKSGAGRDAARTARDMMLATMVEAEIAAASDKIHRKKLSQDEAFNKVAERCKQSVATVKRAHRRFRVEARQQMANLSSSVERLGS